MLPQTNSYFTVGHRSSVKDGFRSERKHKVRTTNEEKGGRTQWGIDKRVPRAVRDVATRCLEQFDLSKDPFILLDSS